MSQARAVAPAGAAAGPAQDDSMFGKMKPILRSVMIFLVIQNGMKYGMSYLGMGSTPETVSHTPNPNAPSDASAVVPKTGVDIAQPAWPLGTKLSMLFYPSTSETPEQKTEDPLFVWDDLTYGDWKDTRDTELMLDVPESVKSHNGTWFMDILLVKGGGSTLAGKGEGDVALYRKQLTRFLPKKRVRKEKKLIGNEEDVEDEPEAPEPAQQIVAHWSNNLTLALISDGKPVNLAQLAPPTAPFFIVAPSPAESTTKHYYPVLFPNDFWVLRESLVTINETTSQLPLRVTYSALGALKFQMYATMTQSMDQAANSQGTGAEMDEVKRMFMETSPWLLITTALVTILHTLFEFLAFSSDIGHWRKKDKDLVGVSVNTILTNCFVQLVILLYLHDSSEQTSFMILFGQGMGLLIEAWKITQVVNIRVREAPGTLIGYQVTFEDKKVLSEDEKKTQEYDKLAFRLVSYFAMPALAGYTVYSLLYETHRGWYSFIVTTLAQAIYMFGFVQLVPQLIINYKLKSVAHMPMKAMMYKTLSTVVDDFFAFCIRMPWLHRLACFRDDVVFVVLLYQRWIYRVDYSRVNEYGQVVEGKVEPVGAGDNADEKVVKALKGETKKNK